MESKISIRDFDKKDVERILSFWKEIFSYDENTIDILRDMIEADKENNVFNIRVMEYERRIAGTVCTKKRLIKFGKAYLLCGDVGYVAVSNELQGKGLGTRLMEDNSRYLTENGFHIARLGGLHRFYSRFGYIPVTSRYWQFSIRDIKAGTKKFSFEDITKISSEDLKYIKEMDKISDWKECMEIEEMCHYDSFGYESLKSPLISLQLNRKFDEEIKRFVYQKEKKILAFIMIYNWEVLFSYGYIPEYYNEFVALLKYVLTEAKNEGKTAVKALFSQDDKLADIFLKNNIGFEIIEHYDAIAGNMIKVVDIEKTIEALTPEIARLLPDTGKLTIEFSDIKRSFTLNLNEAINKKIKKTTSVKEFIHWLKGSNFNIKKVKDSMSFYLGYPGYTEF